ncbi:MAG: hypothetical protein VST66_05760 [Nitrospirota bacterium]|nr:hypothetical protein [Nitrospirota bacterium]
MDFSLVVEKGVGIMYLILALSLIVRPGLWLDFMENFTKAQTPSLVVPFIGLPFGLSIVLLHPNWSWSPSAFVTLFGWLALLKSSTYLLFPEAYVKLIPKRETLRKIIQIEGPLLAAICLLILYHAFFG